MYSIDWAEDVVKTHYKAHARVAYPLWVCHGYSTRILGLWIAKRDPRWELYKCIVRTIEDHLLNDPKLLYSELLCSAMSAKYGKHYEYGGSQGLREFEFGRKLFLQFLKGTVPDRAEEKKRGIPATQPLLFPEEEDNA